MATGAPCPPPRTPHTNLPPARSFSPLLSPSLQWWVESVELNWVVKLVQVKLRQLAPSIVCCHCTSCPCVLWWKSHSCQKPIIHKCLMPLLQVTPLAKGGDSQPHPRDSRFSSHNSALRTQDTALSPPNLSLSTQCSHPKAAQRDPSSPLAADQLGEIVNRARFAVRCHQGFAVMCATEL